MSLDQEVDNVTDEILSLLLDNQRGVRRIEQAIKELGNGNPQPPPDSLPQKVPNIFLCGLLVPSEIDWAIDAGWRWGFGIDAVGDYTALNAFLIRCRDRGQDAVVTLTDGFHTDRSMRNVVDLLTSYQNLVKEVHVEQREGNHTGNPPVWTDGRWMRLSYLMEDAGIADKLYTYRTMWSKKGEYPEATRWPRWASTIYHRYNTDSNRPTGPEIITGAEGSWYAYRQVVGGSHEPPFVQFQLYGQPWQNLEWHEGRRKMAMPTQIDHWLGLLLAQRDGIQTVGFYSARVGLGQGGAGGVNYLWDMPENRAVYRAYWDHTVGTIDDFVSGRPPNMTGHNTPAVAATGEGMYRVKSRSERGES